MLTLLVPKVYGLDCSLLDNRLAQKLQDVLFLSNNWSIFSYNFRAHEIYVDNKKHCLGGLGFRLLCN